MRRFYLNPFRGRVRSANIAKQRLSRIIAHERMQKNQPAFFPELQRELLAVVGKYVDLERNEVSVMFADQDRRPSIELNVTLNETPKRKWAFR